MSNFASFFTSGKELNITELEELKNIIEEKIEQKKKKA
jgi:hypothetical protein